MAEKGAWPPSEKKKFGGYQVWPTLGLGFGPKSDGKKESGYQIWPTPSVLALPQMGKKLLGTKFGPRGLGRPSEGKNVVGTKFAPRSWPPSDGKKFLGTKFGLLPGLGQLPGMEKNCLRTKFGLSQRS